jgi:hypothetical protein
MFIFYLLGNIIVFSISNEEIQKSYDNNQGSGLIAIKITTISAKICI